MYPVFDVWTSETSTRTMTNTTTAEYTAMSESKPKTFFVPGIGGGHRLEGYEVGTPEHAAFVERERERRHREDGRKAEAFITRGRKRGGDTRAAVRARAAVLNGD